SSPSGSRWISWPRLSDNATTSCPISWTSQCSARRDSRSPLKARMTRATLLFGPYKPPALRVGDHAMCLFRDAEGVVYDWSMAPIPWPLCYHAGTRAAGKGILVEEELERAIRNESALAVAHWWGVSTSTAVKWRAALGVKRTDAEGSRRLIHNAALGGLNARRKSRWPGVRLGTAAALVLLETRSDEEVARLTGRTANAVAHMRRAMGLHALAGRGARDQRS